MAAATEEPRRDWAKAGPERPAGEEHPRIRARRTRTLRGLESEASGVPARRPHLGPPASPRGLPAAERRSPDESLGNLRALEIEASVIPARRRHVRPRPLEAARSRHWPNLHDLRALEIEASVIPARRETSVTRVLEARHGSAPALRPNPATCERSRSRPGHPHGAGTSVVRVPSRPSAHPCPPNAGPRLILASLTSRENLTSCRRPHRRSAQGPPDLNRRPSPPPCTRPPAAPPPRGPAPPPGRAGRRCRTWPP